ncbi:MAG: hypothetical protein V4681_02875 [Patescibacteria group bacterium]
MNILKTIGAILAGFITVVILSIATDTALETAGVFPPIGEGFFVPWMLMLALVYRTIFTVVGGYVTAMLGPSHAMRNVTILGCLGIIMGTLGAVAAWELSAHWYPIALVVLALPSTWLGGKLYTLRKRK